MRWGRTGGGVAIGTATTTAGVIAIKRVRRTNIPRVKAAGALAHASRRGFGDDGRALCRWPPRRCAVVGVLEGRPVRVGVGGV
jgi:hypothetical protein